MTFTIRKTRITRNETFLFQFISFHGDLEPLGMEHFYLRKIYMPNNMIHSWYQLTYSSSSLNDTVWWPLHFDIGFLEWKIYWHWKTAKIEENKTKRLLYTECLKKNVVSWKNSFNYPQTHPKCKSRGCFGKFRIFATKWALRF